MEAPARAGGDQIFAQHVGQEQAQNARPHWAVRSSAGSPRPSPRPRGMSEALMVYTRPNVRQKPNGSVNAQRSRKARWSPSLNFSSASLARWPFCARDPAFLAEDHGDRLALHQRFGDDLHHRCCGADLRAPGAKRAGAEFFAHLGDFAGDLLPAFAFILQQRGERFLLRGQLLYARCGSPSLRGGAASAAAC